VSGELFWDMVTPSLFSLCSRWPLCLGDILAKVCSVRGFCPQASEGVPMRFFTKLDQLIDFYKKENMGLVTHLQYPVPLEEEDAIDEAEEDTGRKGRKGWQVWGGDKRTLWSSLTGASRLEYLFGG
jgi:hypothetical protein